MRSAPASPLRAKHHGSFMRWSQSRISHDNRLSHRWDGGEKKSLWFAFFFLVWNVALTLWTGHHSRGQRVCRRVGSRLSNSTAVVLTCEEVRKCLTETRRAEEENVLKRQTLFWWKAARFAYACKCSPEFYLHALPWEGSCECAQLLWQQQPVITDLDCCLLALRGLWRCTWEAAQTCLGLAGVLNWFIGPWFDVLSWSSVADYLFPSCIMFLLFCISL